MELARVYRPKSFLKLILMGFGFVALPLIFGLMHSAFYVGQLSEQSQRAVYQAVQATRSSQMLIEQLRGMERSARQFLVLGDKSLFQVYAEAHQEFGQTVDQLSDLPLDEPQRQRLETLSDKEKVLFDGVKAINKDMQKDPKDPKKDLKRDPKAAERAGTEFAALAEIAQGILAGSNRMVDREVSVMERMAGKTQRVLFWQALALIPGTVIFAGLFIILIARPIRQIDDAIHRLGDAEFSARIRVTGPRDLEYLGKRLDWLRLRLVELEEDKKKFLRHLSHELKTPLTAIREGSELLADQVVGPLSGEQEEIAQILKQNSIHLQKLIEDLLNFSVTQLRSASVERKPLNLANLVEAVLTDHKTAMRAKRLRWHTELAAVTVPGDAEKLRAVVDNLLSNAVKFSPRGGTIRIALRPNGNSAVLDVADSGPGIAEDDRDRIFDAFYQGAAAPEGHVKGTGIGLSIAKEYVLAHRGRIELMDDGGLGAHFRITLPSEATSVSA